MNKLYLTAGERALYDALSVELKEGWEVEEETQIFTDSPQKQMIRFSLLRIHDPKLLSLREKSMKASTVEEVAALIHDADLKGVDEDDLAELFFALGPTVLTRLIETMFTSVKTDADVEGITALTVIRHTILTSYRSVSSSAS